MWGSLILGRWVIWKQEIPCAITPESLTTTTCPSSCLSKHSHCPQVPPAQVWLSPGWPWLSSCPVLPLKCPGCAQHQPSFKLERHLLPLPKCSGVFRLPEEEHSQSSHETWLSLRKHQYWYSFYDLSWSCKIKSLKVKAKLPWENQPHIFPQSLGFRHHYHPPRLCHHQVTTRWVLEFNYAWEASLGKAASQWGGREGGKEGIWNHKTFQT